MKVIVVLNEFHSSDDIERVMGKSQVRYRGPLSISADEARFSGDGPEDITCRVAGDPSVKAVHASSEG